MESSNQVVCWLYAHNELQVNGIWYKEKKATALLEKMRLYYPEAWKQLSMTGRCTFTKK
jgi:hypothetical protein